MTIFEPSLFSQTILSLVQSASYCSQRLNLLQLSMSYIVGSCTSVLTFSVGVSYLHGQLRSSYYLKINDSLVVTIITRICLIIADAIVVVVTWMKTFHGRTRAFQSTGADSRGWEGISSIMLKNGASAGCDT